MKTQCLPYEIVITPSKHKNNIKSIDVPYRVYNDITVVLFFTPPPPCIIPLFLIYQFSKHNSIDITKIIQLYYELDLNVTY